MGLFIDLVNRLRNEAPKYHDATVGNAYAPKTMASGRVRVEVLEALNGRVLEVNTRANENADWETDLYIVRDDEALSEAVAALLIVKGGR